MRWRVDAADEGRRLDQHLAERLATPRHQVQRWIDAGRVRAGGRAAKASHRLVAGEWLECEPLPPPALDRPLAPESGEIDELFADEHLVVLDKPAGLTVHPGAGRPTGTLVHRLLHRYPEIGSVGGPGRPGIVHRLDKDTTGVLVVARSPLAYRRLSADFASRRVEKTYVAIVYGSLTEESGIVDRPVGRHPTRRREMTVRAAGRPARTGYRRRAAANGLSWLELELYTGRTHQIRVHLKSLGVPLVGDPVYGEARWKSLPKSVQGALRLFSRPALHAARIAFDHPATGQRLEVTAPTPADLLTLWRAVTGISPPGPPGPPAFPSPLSP